MNDADVARMLHKCATIAGPDGQLFPNVSQASLLDYIHSLGTGEFKTKDFRTLVGTRTARDEIAKILAPTTAKAYKKAVTSVAKLVAAKLGNTPSVALASYIDPTVFREWRDGVA